MRPRRAAFTLIELLVVITIIVVLLALLAPAMDKAIYQAELAVCAANMHATATSVLSYALAHSRFYPLREMPRQGGHPTQLSVGQWANNPTDDRRSMREYLPSLNGLLVDPLVAAVDIDGSEATSQVFAPVAVYWNWRFSSPGEAAMNRVGSRFTWTQVTSQGSIQYSFNILAGDYEFLIDGQYRGSNHPDDSRMINRRLQDQGSPVEVAGIVPPGLDVTISEWEVRGNTGRGLTDRNTAFDDGSVARDSRLLPAEDDDRMVRVPTRANIDGPQHSGYLPKP